MSKLEKYKYMSPQESVLMKDWAAGNKTPVEMYECLITSDNIKYTKLTYSQQWAKTIDEPVDNALDFAISQVHDKGLQVKHIDVTFDKGNIIIYNDGDGIPSDINKGASEALGIEVRIPTVCASIMFQGSNTEGSPLPLSGTNGLGLKICNITATHFQIETVHDKKLFKQEWKDHMSVAGNPNITSTKLKPYTRLTFSPDYVHFGYDNTTLAAALPMLSDVVRTRCCMAAAYCKYALPNIVIKYNNEILCDTMHSIASRLFPEKPIIKVIIPAKYPITLNTEVHIVIAPHKYNHLSNVNGLVVYSGSHITKLVSQISKFVKEKVTKQLNNDTLKLPANFITNNVFLLINMQIIGPKWTGQRKDVLMADAKQIMDLVLPDKILTQVSKHVIELATSTSTSVKIPAVERVDYDKYERAKRANTKDSLKCRLVAVEGDSAMGQAKTGLSSSVGTKYYGVICLGGVIVNSMKESKSISDSIKKTKKLEKNIFINAFIYYMGLNEKYNYDPLSDTYEKEMSSLKYGGVICMLDPDKDGTQILSLLLTLFYIFWPKLLANNFIQVFKSDIIKLFPKKSSDKVKSYWSEIAFHKEKNSIDLSKYTLNYYKGLGTNTPKETKAMFSNLAERLQTLSVDENTNRIFEIYLGKLPALRKIKLSQPMKELSESILMQQLITKIVSITDLLETDLHDYQIDNLARKLDNMIDGQNNASRKILHGAIKYFTKTDNKKVRVAQLAGTISTGEVYHHGEASLFSAISGRQFTATGGVQLVMFRPLGSCGTRMEGGIDAASPRYVYVCLNDKLVNKIFNPEFYHLLKFNWDGDDRIEPQYYVPIIPLAICESKQVPSNGWKLQLWARDVYKVIDVVRSLINNPNQKKLRHIAPAIYKNSKYVWKGEIRDVRGNEYSVGTYTLHNAKNGKIELIIHELPLRVWIKPFILKLNKLQEKYDFIEKIEDYSDDEIVKIHIILSANTLSKIEGCGDSIYTDDIEEFFKLRKKMNHFINMMGTNNEVREFKSYEDVILAWFPICRELYTARIGRKIIILKLKIFMQEEILRYINAKYTLYDKSRVQMQEFLEKHNYKRLDANIIHDPQFMAVSDIEKCAVNSDTAKYDYLLGLNDYSKLEDSGIVRKNKIMKLSMELDELLKYQNDKMFIGSTLWLRELDELEAIIDEGNKTDWLFEYNDFDF